MIFQEIPIGSYIEWVGMDKTKWYRVLGKSKPYQIHLSNNKTIHMSDFIGLATEPPPQKFKRNNCHQIRQAWIGIAIGSEISWTDEERYTVYRVVGKPSEGEGSLKLRYYDYPTRNYRDITITMVEYISTILYSRANDRQITAWSEAEIFYGINHHGDQDPDQRRRLAFAILRGDPMALDFATDVLKS